MGEQNSANKRPKIQQTLSGPEGVTVDQLFQNNLQRNKYDLQRTIREFVPSVARHAYLHTEALRAIQKEAQNFLQKELEQQRNPRDIVLELQKKIGNEVNLGLSEDGRKVEVRSFNAKYTPRTPEKEHGIEQMGNRLVETMKNVFEGLMPMLKEMKKMWDKVRKFLNNLLEDFQFDNSQLATKDRLIAKQIADPSTETKFLYQHRKNTQRKLDELAKLEDGSALRDNKQALADVKEQRADAEKKLKGEEKMKKLAEIDTKIAKYEAKIQDIETRMSTIDLDRQKYIERLQAIEAALARKRPEPDTGEPAERPVVAPKPVLPEKEKGAAEETPDQQFVSQKLTRITQRLIEENANPKTLEADVGELKVRILKMAEGDRDALIDFLINTKKFSQPDSLTQIYTLNIVRDDVPVQVLVFDVAAKTLELKAPQEKQ